jgi:predicted Zn-dependent protease
MGRLDGARRAIAALARVCAVGMLLAGCGSDLLILGPQSSQPIELPSTAPKVAGAETAAAREHQRLVQAFGGEYRAPAIQKMLEEIADKLRAVSTRPSEKYRVTILNSGLVNAFALPSGNLYVTRGLVALANDMSEIASVLAHEMAHVTSRHAVERAELENRSVLVSRVRAEVLNNPGAAQLVRDQAQVAIASFSRQQELEADQIGVRTLAGAGFDPHGAHRLLIALGRNYELRDRGENRPGEGLDFTATHPSTPERIAGALAIARQFAEPGAIPSDRARWLAALNGLVYGEDSNEGFVRGRTFLHPKLGIAFTAPEGFLLENSAQAVLGMTAGASEALRLDSARIAQDKNLEAFLAENKIEGLALSDVETLTINGMPAATGLARGADWTFRIFAIRSGPTVYRLIMAARGLSAAQDERFRAAAASFRKLTAEEAARARPLRLAIVTARRGETPESFSERMGGIDKPLERFAALNGVDKTAALEPGRAYKTIVD